jgi:hypothetical protein
LTTPAEALEITEPIGDPGIRLAIDLWQFGDDPELVRLLPRLATATAVVQVADRVGLPTAELERLPAGRGMLPLESLILAFVDHGYGGDFEFDPVGEEVASLGYDAVLAETRGVADGLSRAVQERLHGHRTAAAVWQAVGLRSAPAGLAVTGSQTLSWGDDQLRSAGSRRSQASSQTVSRG